MIDKDNYDRKSDKIVGFVRLVSGREPDLSGSESDMNTVHAWSKICPCMPPCTPPCSIKYALR